MGILEKIADIEKEIARTQKNKATEYHLGLLKAKLAKFRQALMEGDAKSGSGKGEGFDVIKSGDARIALIGFPSVGKSTLLSTVTRTESTAASYEFTTLTCIPGVIQYNGAEIQLLDLPGIIEGAAQGKGRGRQVIAVARTADMVLMMLDATKGEKQREILEEELESVGIRLNRCKPEIYFKQKKTGGINITSTVPMTKCSEKMIQLILHEYKLFNAQVLFRDDYTSDEFIDVVVGRRVYMPCLYVYNKIDQVSIEEVDRLAHLPHSVVISCNMKLNIDYMLESIWKLLNLIRIYTKKRGEKPDFDGGLIIRNGTTVEHVCRIVHRTLVDQFKYALVWGTSVKFSPQRVGLSHVLQNEDVICLMIDDENEPLLDDDSRHHTYTSLNSYITTDDPHPRTSSNTTFATGEKLLSGHYESLDYECDESEIAHMEEKRLGYQHTRRIVVLKWLIMLLIGICTGLIAVFVDFTVKNLTKFKFSYVQNKLETCLSEHCLFKPYLAWIGINISMVLIAGLLILWEPVARGSGIPQVKCYLNGVAIPHVLRLKALIAKVLGVIFAVSGGLAVGKEGPMIHAGAIVAGGISQGKSTSLKFDLHILKYFRTDKHKRDFVSAGAAAGVAAAFGAPVGGVLFALEEGASFFNQQLTWFIFFASMTSTFTLNVVMSAIDGHFGDLSSPGLINFGLFKDTPYMWFELPLFIVVGCIGGIFGALFNQLNLRLTKFRHHYINKRWLLVIEVILVAATTVVVAFLLIIGTMYECRPIKTQLELNSPTIQLYCPDGQYNVMGTIVFSTPEQAVRNLFHSEIGTYYPWSLLVFCIIYFCLTCWTYGVIVSSGLFIPSLLIGASWGRLVGIVLHTLFPSNVKYFDPGKYALFGAASQLGGTMRMTISLAVILIEATGDIGLGLPIMIVLTVAKLTGDYFNEGFFDMHIALQSVPFLPWQSDIFAYQLSALNIMSAPVIQLKTVEKVENIYHILRTESHHGFPVVDHHTDETSNQRAGTFQGIILRHQLITMLRKRNFISLNDSLRDYLTMDDFRESYPRHPPIESIHLTNEERELYCDLRPYMHLAYTVSHSATLPRIFSMFRGLGLRHLVVVNDKNEVVGMITRKDLARFRMTHKKGHTSIEELAISH
ncbi:unnamed protein product [Rotaria sordida]|uniref:Chloride channel protein n=1 Tax=Rotaria sordida TaxID=392033 RepID=A0A814AX01_9BILA|nr:unnamed protein product [Rotaria sordida]CAF0921288.1 unnamed protein product [Rotaria sordida]CAF0949728.1 unnamed protein product [Rotaria sordida]